MAIEVADTGTWIPARDRPHVFEPFYRGDRSRHDDGSGLGLSICKAIVEGHGGRIWLAESTRGTRVVFTRPLAQPVPAPRSAARVGARTLA